MKAKNPHSKSMDEIKSKYGCETLKSKEKVKIASLKLAILGNNMSLKSRTRLGKYLIYRILGLK